VMMMSRSNYNYQHKRDGQAALRMRIKDIASARVRYGFRRIHVLLRREGWQVNHKRVYRLYCIEGLNLRTKGKKKRFRAVLRPDRPVIGDSPLSTGRATRKWSAAGHANLAFDDHYPQSQKRVPSWDRDPSRLCGVRMAL